MSDPISNAKPLSTVLLVDDESINLSIFGHYLLDSFSVLAATSGRRALEIAHDSPKPDLILLDVMMPEMDGYEVIRCLKADPATCDIPVIFVTALTTDLDESKGFELGAVDYIYKPCNLAILLARINTQLELKQARERLQHQNRYLEAELEKRLRENQLIQLELLQSEKLAAIGQLAAGIAHEINNPLGYIYANFNTLQNYYRDIFELLDAYEKQLVPSQATPELIGYFNQLKTQKELDFLREDLPALLLESRDGLSRVRQIIKSLNTFADGDLDKWQFANINHCLDSTLDIFANNKNAHCKIHKQYAEIPEVYCLPIQLNQVFLCLLMNAAQAIATVGNITISTGRDTADQVWVEVADDGHGIAPEHLKHVFEPFFTTRPQGQGMGLGLSTAQNIISAHHGKIEVESTPGQGSIFKIRLPISQPNQAIAQPSNT